VDQFESMFRSASREVFRHERVNIESVLVVTDRDEAGAWGKQAAWCDYSRTMGDRQLGVLVMPHPDNFRESWFHVRDYGLLLANPFGRNAFTGKSKSRVVVGREKPLTLKFGVCVHATSTGDEAADCSTMYANYLKLTAAQ